MSAYIDTWGLYPLFSGHGQELVHPDDFERLNRLNAYGKVFHCVGESEGYLVLQHGAETFRVKSELYQTVPPPAFKLGDPVRDKSHIGRTGVVRGVEWHHAKQMPFYLLEVGGKPISKRLWEEDLEPLNS